MALSTIKHVLVTTDFSKASETAFDYVEQLFALSKEDDLRCTVLTVLEDLGNTAQYRFALAMLQSHGVREQMLAEAEKQLEKIKTSRFSTLPVTTVALHAKKPIHKEIISYAEANDVDLIAIATHGRSGFQQLFLGSVSERVIRETTIPVLVVPVDATEESD